MTDIYVPTQFSGTTENDIEIHDNSLIMLCLEMLVKIIATIAFIASSENQKIYAYEITSLSDGENIRVEVSSLR
jgi:hypothetical protein